MTRHHKKEENNHAQFGYLYLSSIITVFGLVSIPFNHIPDPQTNSYQLLYNKTYSTNRFNLEPDWTAFLRHRTFYQRQPQHSTGIVGLGVFVFKSDIFTKQWRDKYCLCVDENWYWIFSGWVGWMKEVWMFVDSLGYGFIF